MWTQINFSCCRKSRLFIPNFQPTQKHVLTLLVNLSDRVKHINWLWFGLFCQKIGIEAFIRSLPFSISSAHDGVSHKGFLFWPSKSGKSIVLSLNHLKKIFLLSLTLLLSLRSLIYSIDLWIQSRPSHVWRLFLIDEGKNLLMIVRLELHLKLAISPRVREVDPNLILPLHKSFKSLIFNPLLN